jgi:hypothetical protein
VAVVRSSRILVKIDEITVKRRRAGVVENEPVIVKMKASHARFLGVQSLDGDDPILQGRFGGAAGNEGANYLRNLGGFRARAFTIISKDKFSLLEENAQGLLGSQGVTSEFKSFDIGFPQGVKVVEVYNWLRGLDTDVINQIGYIRTPSGRKIDFTRVDNAPVAPPADHGEPGSGIPAA